MYLVGDGPTGVLVLSGSSGRVEEDRCRVLAEAGATAASYRWYGDEIDLVPLESFDDALMTLHERCERLVVMGTSRGAEAALLLGARHPEIDAVVSVSGSDVVWAGLSSDRPQRSAWTSGGEPLPFVPYDDSWEPEPGADPLELVGMYEQSLDAYADRVPAARVPVERITGEVVLVAGGDDRLWPSLEFAEEIVKRRGDAPTTLVSHPPAGHRVLLPGEQVPPPPRLRHGGTPEADAELGRRLWPHLLRLLSP